MRQPTIIHGDAQHLPLADCSVDAVVCDPPYELGFMGRTWDSTGVAYDVATWREAMRVLKPGGFLLAFGGSRTWHRLAVAIEDAGFEIRDNIHCSTGAVAWYYGSGFPKSLAVSKDERFCQCVSGVQGSAPEEAAEPAAQILLGGMRRSGEAGSSHVEDLRGLSGNVRAEHEVSGGSECDLLPGMSGEVGVAEGEGQTAADARPVRDGHLLGVRQDVPDEGRMVEEGQVSDLLPPVQWEGTWPSVRATRAQGPSGLDGREPRLLSGEDERCGQPGVEGRGDVQAAEGQLHRPEVRALSGGPAGDGAGGRVRDGAPSRDGALGRSAAASGGVREPRRPESAQQRPVQPGAVPVERGPQAGRVWSLCGGCGKPVVPAGLGTALKPAWEPVVVARRPIQGTVAANVLQWGCGAINVDATRVATTDRWSYPNGPGGCRSGDFHYQNRATTPARSNPAGRWPTNVVLSHVGLTDGDGDIIGDACADGCVDGCPVAELDAQSGTSRSQPQGRRQREMTSRGYEGGGLGQRKCADHEFVDGLESRGYGDTGGASRYFPTFRYQAKAPARERPKVDGVSHPTVKPLGLMRWLVRLVTPPGGTVLDMFAGSGATIEAALLEGFNAIGVERSAEYLPLIQHRIDRATTATQPTVDDVAEPTLFDVA